jgi:hypothetical protein
MRSVILTAGPWIVAVIASVTLLLGLGGRNFACRPDAANGGPALGHRQDRRPHRFPQVGCAAQISKRLDRRLIVMIVRRS